MELAKQNILFFTRTMALGGTENVILQLCEIFEPLVNNIVVCSCGGVNVQKLEGMGIRHYEIPDIEEKKPYVMATVASKIKKIVKKEHITIIHTHHRMAAFYVALLSLHQKCIFINTSHNTFTNRKRLTRFSYKHANLIACGEMVKKNLVNDFGISEQRVQVIHNAVKPFVNQIIKVPELEHLYKQGYFLIGNIGRLSRQKGMEYFIQAMPDIRMRYPNVRFVIIGSGEDENKLKAMVKELDLQEIVIFLGYRSDIQNVMSQLDLIVLSSLWEGLPLTPMEAFSVGKTVVATAVDGTPEIVSDGYNGILIEPENPNQISDGVCKLIQNHELRKTYEKNAHETFEKRFAFDRLKEKYIDFYEEL